MNDDELLERAQRKAELDAIDPATRARLTAARRRALAALDGPQPAAHVGWWTGWAPAGAAAVVALVAVGVALSIRAPAPTPSTTAAGEAGTELEVFLADDDPALYDEDLEFYAWLDEQASAEPPDAG